MKKVICISLCIGLVFLFTSCKLNNDENKSSVYRSSVAVTEPNEDYLMVNAEAEDISIYTVETVNYPVDLDKYSNVEDDCVVFNEDNITEEIDIIPNETVAIKVAQPIFEVLRSGGEEDYVPSKVAFDPEKEVWIVTYSYPNDPSADSSVLSWGFNIALQKKDGKVVKAWYEGY